MPAAEIPRGGITLDLGGQPLPLRAEEVFGHACPIEVEIGVGKGLFLLAWAAARPDIGVIGVERAKKFLDMASARAERLRLSNVRLVHTTAEDLLFRCLEPGSVAAVHVHFPDPWPKKKHHKRRFLRPDNVSRVAEVLAPGGLLRVQTDHAEYAAVVAEVLAGEPALETVDAAEAFEGLPPTNFEVKYGREGRTFHRFAARKSP
ncbi:MAG: tRNA (guanosine(46)-N7)-methyltransferase TrmB [Acidobacteriota bacterium]